MIWRRPRARRDRRTYWHHMVVGDINIALPNVQGVTEYAPPLVSTDSDALFKQDLTIYHCMLHHLKVYSSYLPRGSSPITHRNHDRTHTSTIDIAAASSRLNVLRTIILNDREWETNGAFFSRVRSH